MKIIEGLKKLKDLARKANDIKAKIEKNCSDLENETPSYETAEKQKAQVAEWLQSHRDILKEIESLRLQVQRTNLATEVTIEVSDGVRVTKPIAAWIHRRKDLAGTEAACWASLSDRRLQPKAYKVEGSDEVKIANVRKYYSQAERDKKVEEYTSEPSRIDGSLEVVNAVTDLI